MQSAARGNERVEGGSAGPDVATSLIVFFIHAGDQWITTCWWQKGHFKAYVNMEGRPALSVTTSCLLFAPLKTSPGTAGMRMCMTGRGSLLSAPPLLACM